MASPGTKIGWFEITKEFYSRVYFIAVVTTIFHLLNFQGVSSARFEPRELTHLSTKTFRCKFAKYRPVINISECSAGSYEDSCGRKVCYKDVTQECDEINDTEMVHGKCAPGLDCFCNKCWGCSKNICVLEIICNSPVRQQNENNLIEKINKVTNGDFSLLI